MRYSLMVGRGVSRAIWLSELAAALDAADHLAAFLDELHRGGSDLNDVRACIAEMTSEVERMRLGHNETDNAFSPNWTN